jgi:hypothetical protein
MSSYNLKRATHRLAHTHPAHRQRHPNPQSALSYRYCT